MAATPTNPGTPVEPAATVDDGTRTLTAELRALAAEPALADRAWTLASVAGAVGGGPAAADWAGTDIHQALGTNAPIGPVPAEPRGVQRLELARTALIFSPVVVTWAGLFLAGRAYRGLVRSDPAAAQESFLTLWLQGFRGRTAFGLDVMALVTVLLLVAVVAVSVVIEQRRQRAERAGHAAGEHLARRLRDVATRATLVLAGHRFDASERLREQVAATAAEMDKVVGRARDITRLVEGSLAGLSSAVERIEAGVAVTAAATAGLTAACDRTGDAIAGAVDRAGATVTGLETGVRATLDTAVARSGHAATASAALITRAAEQAEEGLRAATTAMAGTAERTADTVQTLQVDVRRMLAGIDERSARAADHLAATVEELQVGAGRTLDAASTRMAASTGDLAEHVERSAQWLVAATESVLKQSDRALETAETIYDRVGRAVDDVRIRFETGDQVFERIRATVDDLASAGRLTQQSTVDALAGQRQLGAAIERLTDQVGRARQPRARTARRRPADTRAGAGR